MGFEIIWEKHNLKTHLKIDEIHIWILNKTTL